MVLTLLLQLLSGEALSFLATLGIWLLNALNRGIIVISPLQPLPAPAPTSVLLWNIFDAIVGFAGIAAAMFAGLAFRETLRDRRERDRPLPRFIFKNREDALRNFGQAAFNLRISFDEILLSVEDFSYDDKLYWRWPITLVLPR